MAAEVLIERRRPWGEGKPRPLSIMANRPEVNVRRWR
jgi:hypothetical protein